MAIIIAEFIDLFEECIKAFIFKPNKTRVMQRGLTMDGELWTLFRICLADMEAVNFSNAADDFKFVVRHAQRIQRRATCCKLSFALFSEKNRSPCRESGFGEET